MGHTSQDQLTKIYEAALKQVPVGSVWAHYKKPEADYTVLNIVLIEETEQPAVVYQANYSANLKWLRPLDNFLAQIEVDGQMMARFCRKQ